MNCGVAGGQIGGALSKYLVRRYGASTTSIGVGLVACVAALILAGVYFRYQPAVTEQDLVLTAIEVAGVQVGDSGLDIWSREGRYTARAGFWRPVASDDTVRNALEASPTVNIWLYPDSSHIFGIEARDLVIPTSAGIGEYMANRRWLLGLWVAFLAAGSFCVGLGVWLKRRDRVLHAAA